MTGKGRSYKPRQVIESTPLQLSLLLTERTAALMLTREAKQVAEKPDRRALHPRITEALEAWAAADRFHRLHFSKIEMSTMPGIADAKILASRLFRLRQDWSGVLSTSAQDAIRARVNAIWKWVKIDLVTVIGSMEDA